MTISAVHRGRPNCPRCRRQRAEHDAERGDDEGVDRRAKKEQQQRPVDRRADPPMNDELQGQHGGHEDDEAAGDHLRQHDLHRYDRHGPEDARPCPARARG